LVEPGERQRARVETPVRGLSSCGPWQLRGGGCRVGGCARPAGSQCPV